jgi:hypothetical protein
LIFVNAALATLLAPAGASLSVALRPATTVTVALVSPTAVVTP